MVVTRSGSTVTFYIDGVAAGGGTSSATLGFSTCPMVVGTGTTPLAACTGGYTGFWNGHIDDVRVYNRALTTTEITQTAGSPLSGTLYSDEFSTPIGAGKTVGVLKNGVDTGLTADTDASGNFNIIGASYAIGDVLTFYIAGETEKGMMITTANSGATMTGMNLSAGRIVLRADNGALTPGQIDLGVPTGIADISTLWDGAQVSATTFGIQAGTTASELVVLAGHSVNLSTVTSAINVNTGLDIGGTFNVGSNNLNVAGTFEVDGGGTYTASGNTMTLSGSGNVAFGFSGTFPSNLAVNLGSGFTATLTSALNLGSNNLSVSGGNLSLNGNNLTMSGGAFSLGSGTKLRLRGTETVAFSGGTVQDVDSGTWEFVGNGGAGPFNVPDWGPTDYFDLSINDSSGLGEFDLGANLNVAGSVSLLGGTLDLNGTTANIGGTMSVGGTSTVATGASGILNVTGAVTQTGGTLNIGAGGKIDTNAGLAVSGTSAVTMGSGGILDIATNLTMNSGGALTVTGGGTLVGGGMTLDASAAASFSTSSSLSVTGAVSLLGGGGLTYNGTGSALTVGGAVGLTGSSLTLGANASADFNGALTLSGASSVVANADATLDVAANFDVGAGGSFSLGTNADLIVGGSLGFGGTSFTTSSGTTTSITGALNATAGTLGLSGTTLGIGTNLAISGTAALTLNTGLATSITGNLSIGSGSSLIGAGTPVINLAGNWTKTGTFTSGSSTVTLTGGNQTLAGATTFFNLAKSDAVNDGTNKTLSLTSGTTFTTTGTLTLDGLDASDRLVIDATTDGSAATLNFSGASSSSAIGNFLSITDNAIANVSGGAVTLPINPASSLDGGNTTNWFTSFTATVSTGVATSGENPATNGQMTINLGATNTTGNDITFTVSASGSATSGTDYTIGTTTIPNGSSSVVVPITVLNDSAIEGDETAVLTLAGASLSTVSIGSPSAATITIWDDETDTDGDGSPDAVELADGTSRTNPASYTDTDGDKFADWVETNGGGNPSNNTVFPTDTDNDTVPDVVETLQGTNPNNLASFQDTDSDSIPDYMEIIGGSNPNDPGSELPDADNDGVPNLVEIQDGTNPSDAASLDTDHDGIANATDTDDDNDGVTDLAEAIAPGGDGNGDGVSDALQINVASSLNPATSAVTTLEVSGPAKYIMHSNVLSEADLPQQNSDVDFPVGLNEFNLLAPAPGASATARVIYDKVYDTSQWQFYSAFPAGGFARYTGPVSFATGSVLGRSVTTASFTLTDGGALDYDGVANGIIDDPHGPAHTVGGLASTGQGTQIIQIAAAVLLIVVIFTTTIPGWRSRQLWR